MFKPVVVLLGIIGASLLALVLVIALRKDAPRSVVSEISAPRAAPVAAEPARRASELRAGAASSPPARPVATSSRLTARIDAGAREDETAILARVAALASTDLNQSLQLARETLARHPESPNAPELYSDIAKDLVHLGRIEEAEDVARLMLQKYPNDPFTLDVERHVLRHPPNPRDLPGAP